MWVWLGMSTVIENNKLLYLRNKLRYEFEFLHVVRQIHPYDSVYSYECGWAQLRKPKVIPNIKPAIWKELMILFFIYG